MVICCLSGNIGRGDGADEEDEEVRRLETSKDLDGATGRGSESESSAETEPLELRWLKPGAGSGTLLSVQRDVGKRVGVVGEGGGPGEGVRRSDSEAFVLATERDVRSESGMSDVSGG